MQKILFLADLHGNLPATLALEKEIEKIKPDDIWFLGDAVGKGPESDKTLDWVRANCRHFISGNWDIGCVETGKLCEKDSSAYDPDQLECFEDLLKISRENSLVPNFTTSGYGMTPEIAALCKKYCGAVAVSWYRSKYTLNAIQMLLDAGVKTNIHYVLGKNSIDEAIDRLERNDFPKGINAVIFLLHKPAGQGSKANVLDFSDPRVAKFFAQVDKRHPFKVGMDSCNVPGAINYCKSILPESLDTCEGGRYSCYIGADMVMVPCSFDQQKRYEVQLDENTSIVDAWNSEPFERFRGKMRSACPDCDKKDLCMGGCPLMPEIVFCGSQNRVIIK